MSQITDLGAANRRTVKRLSQAKLVSVDQITGLVDTLKNEFYKEHPDATGDDWNYGTTTINGSEPPGPMVPLRNTVKVVDEIVGDQHILVMIGTRKPGTRVGIHVNENGGAVFYVGGKGRISDFVQGFPNAINSVGSYKYLPSNIPMSEANLTKGDVRMLNIFVAPIGEPFVTYIEPGSQSTG